MTLASVKRQRGLLLLAAAFLFFALTAWAQDDGTDTLNDLKHPETGEGLSAGAEMARFGPISDTGSRNANPQPGLHDHGRGGNTFVNDPCIDPPPPDRSRTVQSETEIAVFGKYMVTGYNDSFGFYDNTQGLSGYSYSVNGGNTWIDGSGLPPLVKTHSPFTDPASDHYFGDPVIVVDKSPRTFMVNGAPVSQPAGTFYYASLYSPPGNPEPGGIGTIAVNRGTFQTAPPQTVESVANTRCGNNTALNGTPDTTNLPKERIIWEPPVVAVPLVGEGASDFLDKEWMAVNQATGELYITYVRFADDAVGSTPLELVRSKDGGRTWEGPFVIVPNLSDTFNTGIQPTITGTGRIVVSYLARTFSAGGSGPESDNRVEAAFSDDDGTTWSTPIVVQHVNPQGEPNGYNRGRRNILNAPYISPQAHGTDVYITYFNGKTPLESAPGVIFTGPLAKQADIILASSHDNGMTWTPTRVNDDPGTTSHVFPSVQVNKNNWVYVGWTDRRFDPAANEYTDEWAAVSHDGGATFGHNVVQTDVSTNWRGRADARPNFGDYNSSELLGDNQFVITWADGRFPGGTFVPPACTGGPPCDPRPASTPDTIFTIANGLGTGTQ
ncbi:MAG: hypothetical protein ACJ71N_09455 [Terriglobales bacterium]|jgi:hypothetical protein